MAPGQAKRASRRDALRMIACAPAAWALVAGGAGQAQEAAAPVCPSEDDGMRASLNYIEVSAYGAERDCRNCDFWVAAEGDAACGGCTLIAGPISPYAYCDSWALMAGAAEPEANQSLG